jgi:hypothetical protein
MLVNFSFVVGFGSNYPLRPHHQASSCPQPPEPCNRTALLSPKPNPKVLFGALVGGPTDATDFYEDNREGSIDYKESALRSTFHTMLLHMYLRTYIPTT